MVNAIPYDTFFNRPSFKNKLKVKLPENPISTPDEDSDDGNALIPLFESIGAGELARITRQDLVGGIGLNYEIIGELDTITKEITAKMLKAGPVPPSVSMPIDISKYISPVDLIDDTLPGIMIDDEGNLIINLLQLSNEEVIEVQALAGGSMIRVPYGLEEE